MPAGLQKGANAAFVTDRSGRLQVGDHANMLASAELDLLPAKGSQQRIHQKSLLQLPAVPPAVSCWLIDS